MLVVISFKVRTSQQRTCLLFNFERKKMCSRLPPFVSCISANLPAVYWVNFEQNICEYWLSYLRKRVPTLDFEWKCVSVSVEQLINGRTVRFSSYSLVEGDATRQVH